MRLRADEALLRAGLCDTLEQARAYIMEGKVINGTQKIIKSSEMIKQIELLRIKDKPSEYVSRGAYKLKKAFEVFDIDAKDKVCIDIGASTGGFTDIMIRQGARKVYAVDVGYNLLDWKIRSNPRVVVLEKTNARFLTADMLEERPSFGATDVSFISLKAVLPAVFSVLMPNSDFIALIKPQFEADRNDVGEKGVVRDAQVHINVIKDIVNFVQTSDISACALDYSPIRGPEGNIEFLLHLRNDSEGKTIAPEQIEQTVARAHESLC